LSAARAGAADVVELLVAHGAQLNLATRTGMTPLMAAAHNGNPEVVRALLERGADAILRNRDGQTALMLAEEKHDRATVLVLQAKRNSNSR